MTTSLPVRLAEGPRALATRDLTKGFGGHRVLSGVTLEVPEGSVYVLAGPNGAGKTTLIRVLLDLVRADGGSAEVLGLSPARHGARVRARVGYVPERHDWGYPWMRVGRLLRHHATFYPAWDAAYARRLVDTFEVPLEARVGRLSKGQVRRVQLVMALAHRPPVLLLDEPTDGLDPVTRDDTLGLMAEHLAETPSTVLISTHLVQEVEGLADHLGVMRGGRLRAQLPVEELRRGLRSYRAEVPEGWRAPEELDGAVLRRREVRREVQWTVWGEEAAVAGRLAASGATLREVAPLTLSEATLALLGGKEA